MIDTYDKNADNRKKFKKSHGDGEDPIIIAQRFLNIFRQLHIFSKERKDAFNKMILEQPPEIRGMFGSLPGGSLLQEYVDDLEQSVGVVRDHSGEFAHETTSPELSEELSKAKILATALADAQAQAAAKLQAESPSQAQPIFTQTPHMAQAPIMSGNVKVVADSSFAKEIAAAFSQALKFNETQIQTGNKQLAAAVIASQEKMAKIFAEKTDNSALTKSIIASQEKMAQALADNALALQKLPIKSLGGGKESALTSGGSNQEILDAIRESQDRMAQMIMQHNTMAASNSSNNNANNIQINTAPMPPMEDMVKGIVKAQSELFREMAQTQTKELSAIISVALKESQQLSSKTIAEAIEKIQKENRKFFEEQAKFAAKTSAQPVYVRDEHFSQTRHIPASEERDTNFQIPEANPSSGNDELAELFSGENNTSKQTAINTLVDDENSAKEMVDVLSETSENMESPLKKKKKKKKKKNKTSDGIEDSSGLDFSLFDDGAAQAASKIKDGLSSLASSLFKKDNKIKDEKVEENTDLSLQDLSGLENIDIDSLTNEDNPSQALENIKESETERTPEINTASSESDESEWTWEEVPEDTSAEVLETAPEADVSDTASESDESEWTWEEVPEDTSAEVLETAPEADVSDTASESDESEWTWEEVPEETSTEVLETAPEADVSDTASESDEGEWTWEEVPEETSTEVLETAPEADVSDTASESDEGEWTWEEVPEETSTEVLETEPEADINNTSLLETSEEETQNAGDWEWDYEEDAAPEEGVSTESDILTDEAQNLAPEPADASEDEGDWEWDYEEDTAPEEGMSTESDIPADEAQNLTPETVDASEDEGDWEWDYEYEEDTPPEGTTESQNAVEQIKASDKSIIFDDTDASEDSNNPLYNGDLIFQDSLYKTSDTDTSLTFDNLDFGIAEINKDKDSKEPYAPKDDIVG